VRDAIELLDRELGRLVDGLRRRRLLDATNIVLVSDHGMAITTRAQTIVVDDLVSPDDVEIADINPTLGVTPKPGREAAVARALLGTHPRLTMYRREETPVHWQFRGQPRVPALTGVADEGWVVLRRASVESYWINSDTGGQHGYDPATTPSMRGIFIGAGPAFRRGVTVPAFANVSVYNVLARLVGAMAPANDGDPSMVGEVLGEGDRRKEEGGRR
jgi:arylsulfatase A-like enzyme